MKGSLKTCDVVGIRNHGFSLGPNLHEAASRLEMFEESARIHLDGLMVGGVSGLSEEQLKSIRVAHGQE